MLNSSSSTSSEATPDVVVHNHFIDVKSKRTNIAVWCNSTMLGESSYSKKPIRYYLVHRGEAKRTLNLSPVKSKRKQKLAVLFPGFNGGQFDLCVYAEYLAARGYWVMSPSCYIDPDLSSSSKTEDVAAALSSVYPQYDDVLMTLGNFLGTSVSCDNIDHIVYVSFSSGIYPLLHHAKNGHKLTIPHHLILLSPGLSKCVDKLSLLVPVSSAMIVHSLLDDYPKFGDPAKYVDHLRDYPVTLNVLEYGRHFDYVCLPSKNLQHVENDISDDKELVENSCLEFIEHQLDEVVL